MRILEKYNAISKALVYRFPVLMLDEAQDTSEVQMKIIDLLERMTSMNRHWHN